MKNKLLLLLILPFLALILKAKEPKPLQTTQHFAFYSNFWINLHHFAYNIAKEAKKADLEKPSQHELLQELTEKEKQIADATLQYYQKHLVDKDLLFNGKMYDIKRYLIGFSEKGKLKGADYRQ